MLVDKTVTEFVNELASNAPMPGGGGAAALSGALGAALGLMVCNLTEGKEQFGHCQAEVAEIKQQGLRLKNELTHYVDEDGKSFLKVMKAYKLPKSTAEEQESRNEAIQEAIKNAARVSLQVANLCLEVMGFASRILLSGNPNAASEAVASGVVAYGGLQAAICTVNINLSAIKDQGSVKDIKDAVRSLLERAEEINRRILTDAEKVIVSPVS